MGILFEPEESPVGILGDSAEAFEGVEKRLQLSFFPDGSKGLKALSRLQIEQVLSAARCAIVTELSDTEVDSYVLSESSLFVYPYKVIIKTCGTTKLLGVVPMLLSLASQLFLEVKGCKYTRGSFFFPKGQPYPHGSFVEEVEYLDGFFGKLGAGSKAYVLGEACKKQNWHIYSASAVECDDNLGMAMPIYTLEICMTNLDRKKASHFYKVNRSSAAEMTQKSGIATLLPKSKICDFAFDPCGYSMNSLDRGAVSTIHVTPEKGFSYASFEAMGYDPHNVDFQTLINDVLSCFKPAVFSTAVHVSGVHDFGSKIGFWRPSVSPDGYFCDTFSMKKLPGGDLVSFHTFVEQKSGLALEQKSDLGLSVSLLPKQCAMPVKNKAFKDNLHDGVKNTYLHWEEDHSNVAVKHLVAAINPVPVGPNMEDLDDFLRKQIVNTTEDAFYVVDIGVILRLWQTWKLAMPSVHPFYAVKCNSDVLLLAVLASLGAGFDIASKAELDIVRDLGVGGDRIIYANPCKLPSHILYAANHDVHLTTFDSEGELYKLYRLNPEAEVVLRIRVCDAGARCPLGVKYGAEMEDCESLLGVAKSLGLKVVGIAFHVGSGASDPSSFAHGIAQARVLFDMARSLEINTLRLLDIGGGFVSDGGLGVSFAAAAASINEALDKYFPPSLGTTVIAEPGRFFAEESFTLAAQVFGNRVRKKNGREFAEYWISDGIYGSMNCLLYDHATLSVRALQATREELLLGANGCESTVFGPTCDGLDTVMENVWLPHLECGDWLVFPRMGAYTKSAASTFNGFDTGDMKTFCVQSTG